MEYESGTKANCQKYLKNMNRKYILTHMSDPSRIKVLTKTGEIIMEDCAILLK